MKITIAICTWNRASLLDQTLTQMTRLHIPDGAEWELLVVNNNCTDETDDIIARHDAKLPIRRIFENKTGLSHARNAAVSAATGDYILWTDDDVLVDPGWIAAYALAFQKWPEASVFGGPIEPWFEGTPPNWLIENWGCLSSAFATRDLGNETIELKVEGQQLPYGANFAVRMSEQTRFLYDPNFGLNQGNIILGEETRLIESIIAEGFSGRWVPDARVRHWLPKSRQTIAFIKKYFIALGYSLRQRGSYDSSAKIFGYPRWLVRDTIAAYSLYYYKLVFAPRHVSVPYLAKLYINRGQLFGK